MAFIGKAMQRSACALVRPIAASSARRAVMIAASRGPAMITARAAPCVATRAWSAFPAAQSRALATVGSDGSDSDFAPKAKETPQPSGDRDVHAEIKEVCALHRCPHPACLVQQRSAGHRSLATQAWHAG